MRLVRKQALSLALIGTFLLLTGVAAAENPPLTNWAVPKSSAVGKTVLSDIGPGPVVFVAVTPCRQYSSRPPNSPLLQNTPRTVTLTGTPCDIPSGVVAVSVNITVFDITGATGNGVFKVDTVSPPLIAWINYPPTEMQRANAGVVTLTGAGAIVVQVNQGGGSVNFTVDVNGYYIGGGNSLNSNERLWISGSSSGNGMIKGTNSASGGIGGFFEATGGGNSIGVYGTSSAGDGVHGVASAISGKTIGVQGENFSATDGAAGVTGVATSVSGKVYGVQGVSFSTADQAYGVVGIVGGATWNPVNFYQAGGRFVGGQANSHGVVAEGQKTGVMGFRVDGSGTWQTYGSAGYLGTDGLYTPNHLTAVGGKSFAEPLPTDPSKVIKYVCLEGPESGTYFRGRGRFVNKAAVIEVPEHFRIVTEEEGLTVQITPIGRAAAVGVVRIGLDEIEVESTRDVEFSYLVQGIRKAYKDWQPVQNATPSENPYFIPTSASHRLESFWPEEIKRRLISNGTYNADGSVNIQTAERMGWAQKWRDEEKARAEAARQALEQRKSQGLNGQ